MIIFSYILIAALFSFGWCTLFNDGMIFGTAGEWMRNNLKEWVAKPLFDCPICNAFWVALIMFFTIFPPMPWWNLPLIGLSAVGVNSIILGFQNRLDNITDAIDPTVND